MDSRVEQALQQGAPHLRVLADQLPVMIIVTDTHGKGVFVNTRFQTYLGGSVQELGGSKWQQAVHPDDQESAREAWTHALTSGEPYQLEVRILHAPSGEHRWNLLEATPVRDDARNVIRWLCTITDVHPQKLAQERQAILAELGSYALQGHDLLTLMGRAMQLVCKTLQMDFCAVLKLLPDSNELLLKAGVGWPEELIGKATIRTGHESQAGYTLQARGPVIVDDLQGETRFQVAELMRQHGAVSGLSVPIETPEGTYGVIGTHAREPRAFSDSDASFLQGVANVLGEAVQRRRAEEALRKSEGHLRALFRNTEQSFVLLDPTGTILMANPVANARARRITGREMTLGGNIREFLLPESRSALETNLGRALAGETVRIERSIPAVDGDILWFLFTYLPVQEDDEVVGISFSAIDITNQKRTEERLRESEERFRLVFENAAVGIALLAPDGAYLDVNEHLCDLLGYTRDELTSLPPASFGHPDDERTSTEAIRRLFEGGETSVRYEKRYLRKGGEVLWADVVVSAVRAESGNPRYFIVALQDVTARKAAEQAVQESERGFRSVFNNAAVGVARIDLDGSFIEVNDHLCEELGYPREDLVRLTFQDITYPDDLEADVRQAEALARGEISSYHMEKRYLRKDSSIMWGQLTGSIVRDEDGAPLFFIGIIENIDARKAVEAALQELNETLERRVAERTAELQTLNAELEAFSYSVSHDLRAPLRGIDGFSQALLEDYDERLDDIGKGYLKRIRGGANRMGELIDALLTLSRHSRGALRVADVDLSRMAGEVAGALQGRDPARRVSFLIAEGLVVGGDEAMLRVVVENLLENAFKFTRDRDLATIEFGRAREGGEDEAFFVRDNGAGFDMKYADKLFVPFQRLHSPREFMGTGIGLATVQRIVRRHGGRIWAQSQPGEGATFWFTLHPQPGK